MLRRRPRTQPVLHRLTEAGSAIRGFARVCENSPCAKANGKRIGRGVDSFGGARDAIAADALSTLSETQLDLAASTPWRSALRLRGAPSFCGAPRGPRSCQLVPMATVTLASSRRFGDGSGHTLG